MIGELSYNYYGIPTGREVSAQWNSSVKLGSLTNRTMLEEQDKHGRGKAFDESIYLWKIKPSASFACNAAFNIATGNTLNIDVAINKRDTPVSLAVGTVATESTAPYVGFYTQPRDRIGYDDLRAYNTQNSNLCYDIPYNRYCIYCGIQCLDYNSSPLTTVGHTLSTLKSYIDNNNADVVFLRSDLYTGTANDRRISNVYTPITEEGYNYPYYESIIADILTDRPIPDSATLIKNAIKDGHDSYIDNVVYSPFTTAIKRNWYQSKVTSINQLLNIGIHVAYDYSTLRAGAQTISGANKVTGQFMKVSTEEQIFNDVCYKWVLKWYDDATGAILENGYDITSRTGGGRLISVLTITDDKGQTKGEAVTRAVKHELAYIGFYFTDTQSLAMSGTLGTSGDGVGVYLPEKIGGVTTGNYFTGDDIKHVPYADADSCADFAYSEETAGGDSGDLTTHLKNGYVAGGQWYKMTNAQLSALSTWLNTTYKPDAQTLSEDFKGVNPSDYIISLKYYPFEVSAGSSGALSIGGLDTGTTAAYFTRFYGKANTSIDNSYFNLGSFTMQPPYCFGNFLDKYLKIQLYIPYCGFVDLDSTVYCPSPDGTIHTINIALQVDYATGQCVGLIYRDALLMDTVQGCCGVDIPFSALQQGSYQNNVKQAELAIKQAKAGQLKSILGAGGAVIGTAAAAFTGNVPGVLLGSAATVSAVQSMKTADISRESADYNLDHTAPAVSGVESASPFNAMIQEDSAKILIYKPVLLQGADLAAYAKTTGYACCKQGKLSSFKGLTVCSSSQLNFDAPAAHKTQLQQMLAKGVYV